MALTDFTVVWQEIRRKRDARLQGSDWTQYPDSPLSDSKKTEWATYRQQLRDLPTSANPTIDDNGRLNQSSVTWPTKPS